MTHTVAFLPVLWYIEAKGESEMRKLRAFGLFLLLCAALTVSAGAQEADHTGAAFQAEGFSNSKRLWDGDQTTWSVAQKSGRITVSRSGGIAGLYLLFDRLPRPWTLNGTATCGEEGFLHQYVDVPALLGGVPAELTLEFPAGTALSEVYALSRGELPSWVQVWEPPLEEADLMLVSSHSDDEQLFFAGLLPYYAVERELAVQVVYFVQHFEVDGRQDHRRPHEQLDGLWTVGIRNYPIISDFPDLYSQSKNRAEALAQAQQVYRRAGSEYEDFVRYLAACIRRCRPLVVVSHDLDGEYGHGAHVLCADALTQAVHAAADPSRFPDSGGPWAVEKLYLHLYEENPVTLDLDTPSDRLGGKSPFQVTQEGFAYHKSQHWTWFYKWIYGAEDQPITRAADIKTYSPCRYGLYYTAVGPDEGGGDFFEHIETHAARRARLEAEAQAAREAEEEARRQAEEARAEAEAQARAEEEALAQAAQREQTRRHTRFCMAAAMAGVILALCAGLLLLAGRTRGR